MNDKFFRDGNSNQGLCHLKKLDDKKAMINNENVKTVRLVMQTCLYQLSGVAVDVCYVLRSTRVAQNRWFVSLFIRETLMKAIFILQALERERGDDKIWMQIRLRNSNIRS